MSPTHPRDHQILHRVVAFLLVVSQGCSTDVNLGDIPAAAPGLELDAVPYETARKHFRTNLIRSGPASDLHDPLVTPPGAIEVTYRSGEQSLKAYASPMAAGLKRQPGVLFLHGGFSMGSGHWALTQPFRDAGFVVMVPTLRGENGQGGACSLFYDEVDDVLAAADALAARSDLDSGRMFLAGHSVGGTLTLLTAQTSSRFVAAASFSAAPDLFEYTRGRPERIPFPPGRPEEHRMRSAVAFATSFRCPTRLFHGEDELWLQPATRRTALLAERAGLDVRAIELPGGHDSVSPESVALCLRFFRDQPAKK